MSFQKKMFKMYICFKSKIQYSIIMILSYLNTCHLNTYPVAKQDYIVLFFDRVNI